MALIVEAQTKPSEEAMKYTSYLFNVSTGSTIFGAGEGQKADAHGGVEASASTHCI